MAESNFEKRKFERELSENRYASRKHNDAYNNEQMILRREIRDVTDDNRFIGDETNLSNEIIEKRKLERKLKLEGYELSNHNQPCNSSNYILQSKITSLSLEISYIKSEIRKLSDKRIKKENLERKLRQKEYELQNHNQRCNSINSILQSKICFLSTWARYIESEIRKAKIPPDPVFHPLPQNKTCANRLLFFLHMPVHIEILARFTIMSQQMLLPNTDKLKYTGLNENNLKTIRNSTEVPRYQLQTSLKTYYNNHNPSQRCLSWKVHIYSAENPTRHVGPYNVMEFTKIGEGCWYPDNLSPFMIWDGEIFH